MRFLPFFFFLLILTGCGLSEKIDNRQWKVKNAENINNRAIRVYLSGNPQEAILILDSLNEYFPTYYVPYGNKGYIYQSIGVLDSALSLYNFTLKKMPDNAEVWFNRGSLHELLGMEKEAFQDYYRAYELGFENKYLFNNIAMILKQKKEYEKALDFIDLAISLDTNFIIALDNKAMILNNLGNYLEAVKYASQAISRDSSIARNFNNRSLIYINLEQFKMAQADCLNAIELDPNYAYPYNNLGFIMDELGRSKEALEYYNLAIKLDPEFNEAKYNRAKSHLDRMDTTAACIDLSDLYESDFLLPIDSMLIDFYAKNCSH
jgi:tetratricopeptide (TPR) repeat protein